MMEKNELLYAGVLSSGIAFLLQALSQQNLSPAPVAIIFSLEGVFAAIFGWILLNQFLNDLKIFGIVLIEIILKSADVQSWIPPIENTSYIKTVRDRLNLLQLVDIVNYHLIMV